MQINPCGLSMRVCTWQQDVDELHDLTVNNSLVERSDDDMIVFKRAVHTVYLLYI